MIAVNTHGHTGSRLAGLEGHGRNAQAAPGWGRSWQVLGGAEPTWGSVQRMPYLQAVVLEALRLQPPAYIVGRCASRPLRLGGHHLAAGAPCTCQAATQSYCMTQVSHACAAPDMPPLSWARTTWRQVPPAPAMLFDRHPQLLHDPGCCVLAPCLTCHRGCCLMGRCRVLALCPVMAAAQGLHGPGYGMLDIAPGVCSTILLAASCHHGGQTITSACLA